MLVLCCYLGFKGLKVTYSGLEDLVLGCEVLRGVHEGFNGFNGFFQFCDSESLVEKVLCEGGVGFLELVDFQLLFVLRLKEGSKACAMGCEGYGVVLKCLSVLG